MKKIIKFISVTVLAFVLFIAITVILTLLYINTNHAAQLIQSNLNTAIPGTVLWKRHHLSLFKGELAFDDLRIMSTQNEEVIKLELILAKISLPKLVKKELKISGLSIKNPKIDIATDSSGFLNITKVFVDPSDTVHEKKEDKDTDESPFNVVVDNFRIDQAAFSFAANRGKKNIVLKEINISASGNLLKQVAKLNLAVQGITVSFGTLNLEFNDLNLSAGLHKDQVKPVDLTITGESSSIVLSGSADSVFTNPLLSVNLEVETLLEELQENLQLPVQLSGNAILQLNVKGTINNPDAELLVDYKGGKILENRLSGALLDVDLSNRIARVKNLSIAFPTGLVNLTGNADMQQVFETGFLDSSIDFDKFTYQTEIDIAKFKLDELIWLSNVLKGSADAKLSVTGRGVDHKKLSAQADIILLADNLASKAPIDPIDASANITASMQGGVASLEKLLLTIEKSNIAINGNYNIPNNTVSASLTLDTAHLEKILSLGGIDSIGGRVTLNASINGPVSNPTAECSFSSSEMTYKNFTVGDVSFETLLDKSGVATLSFLTIKNQRSNLQMAGSTQLFNRGTLKPLEESVFDIEIRNSGLYLEDFIDSLKAHADLTAHITGSPNNLGGFISLEIDSIDLGVQKCERATLSASLDSQRITLKPLVIHIAAEDSLILTGWASLKGEYDLALHSPAINLNSINALDSFSNVNGTVIIDLFGNGSFKNPQAYGTVSIKDIDIQHKMFDDINLSISLKDQVARINGELNFGLNGSYNLNNKYYNAVVHFNNTELSPYLGLIDRKELSGRITGTVTIAGYSDSLDRMQSTFDVPDLVIFHKAIKVPVISTQSLAGKFTGDSIVLSPIHIALLNDGKIDLTGNGSFDGALDFSLDGNIPLNLVSLFTEDLPDAKGNLHIASSLKGTRQEPLLRAEVKLNEIGLTIPFLMQELHSVNGRISATPELVTINSIDGKLDDGNFTCKGTIKLDSLAPSDIAITFNAQSLPVQLPDMVDVLVNSEITATGGLNKSVICQGELVLLEGIYYQDIKFNPLSGVIDKKREVKPIDYVEDTSSLASKINLDIDVKSRQSFSIDNNLVMLEVMPDLKIVGTAKKPLINGRVKSNEGTVNYYLREFTVEKGILDFINPYKIDPTIDIQANTKIQDYTITLNIIGTIEDLIFKLSSDKSLEDEDIISLLVLGRTAGELREGKVGSASSEQILAQLIDATLGESIKKVAGLDILEINTKDSSNVIDKETERIEVTVGKALTKRLTTKYSIESLNGELTQRAIIEYKILENLLLETFNDDKGNYGGNTRFKLEFR